MAAAPNYLNPNYNTNQVNYLNQDYNSSNPRTIAANQQGMNAQGAQAAQQNATATQNYLNPTEQSWVQGQGGYTPSQVSQIEMTPAQQQAMITSAGISSGTATQAAADAAQRATAAAGGNPLADAAYRQRAAQQAGVQAGNAETNAQVGAQQAQAQNVENVGQTQIGQENVGAGLQSQYQNQQNTDVQNAQNRAQQGVQSGLNASQTPSTFDQVAGGVAGALSFLDMGGLPSSGQSTGYRAYGMPPAKPMMGAEMPQAGSQMANYLDMGGGGREAIVAERSPEAVVKVPNYLDDGMPAMSGYSPPPDTFAQTETPYTAPVPGITGTPGTSKPQSTQSIWQKIKQQGAPASANAITQGTNPSNIGQTIGSAAGKLAGLGMKYLDGGAILTQPTKVSLAPDEAVVPLHYRKDAKARPSMAMPLVNQIQGSKIPMRKPYPGLGGASQGAMA